VGVLFYSAFLFPKNLEPYIASGDASKKWFPEMIGILKEGLDRKSVHRATALDGFMIKA
jgi:hypothetical protein